MKKLVVQILTVIENEPAVIAGAVNALVALLLAFGVVVHVSKEQLASVVVGLAAVSGVLLRAVVSPTGFIHELVGSFTTPVAAPVVPAPEPPAVVTEPAPEPPAVV